MPSEMQCLQGPPLGLLLDGLPALSIMGDLEPASQAFCVPALSSGKWICD